MIWWQNKLFTINQETKYFAISSEDLIYWVFYTLSDNINTDDLQLKKNLLLAAKPNFRRCCTASDSHQSKLWPPANLVFLRISVTPNISYFSHSDILAADQSCMSSARPTSVIIKLVIKIKFWINDNLWHSSLQGHQELSRKSDENKSLKPKPISFFYLYYDRTLLLFSRPMRDKDTSAFREIFQ